MAEPVLWYTGSAQHRITSKASLLYSMEPAAQRWNKHGYLPRLQGWQGLQQEMALDMGRLWHRNLGRDDRLVSDHGRESRHPFLDEALLQLLLALPLPLVADLTLVTAPCLPRPAFIRRVLLLAGRLGRRVTAVCRLHGGVQLGA